MCVVEEKQQRQGEGKGCRRQASAVDHLPVSPKAAKA